MANVIHLPSLRQRARAEARALENVERLLELCRDIEMLAGTLTRKTGISIGEQIRPDLVATLEALVRTLRRS